MNMTVAPSKSAQTVAELLSDEKGLQFQILAETLDAMQEGQIKESGRTVCPDSSEVKQPMARYETAVDLSSCPWGATGIMHSHVSRDQLRKPEHSLVDISNVLFGPPDASLVAGIASSEVFMFPGDASAAIDVFEDVIGTGISGPDDVIRAIEDGVINDPAATRSALKEQLPHLYRRVPTNFSEFESDVKQAPITVSAPEHGTSCGCLSMVWPEHTPEHAAVEIRQNVFEASQASKQTISEATEGINLGHIVVAAIVGDVVSAGVRSLWNDARQK